MATPFGYTMLPGPPSTPPPNGYAQAPDAHGIWWQYPSPGTDNSMLGSAVTPSQQGQANAAAAQENAFGLGHIFDSVVNSIPLLGPAASTEISTLGGAANVVSGAVTAGKAAAGFLGFISDLPRLATTLIGVILIIAGIFALSKGPAVSVVGSVAKEALVG